MPARTNIGTPKDKDFADARLRNTDPAAFSAWTVFITAVKTSIRHSRSISKPHTGRLLQPTRIYTVLHFVVDSETNL
jgi:hypothetical protein